MVTGTYTPDRYDTDGVQTEFDIKFEFKSEDHIHVWVRNKTTNTYSKLLNPTDYDVDGAKIVTTDTWPSGYEFIIKRILGLKQNTDYIPNDDLPADTVEWDFDKVVEMVQQHEEMLSRSPKLSEVSQYSDIIVEEPIDGYSLVWDGTTLKTVKVWGTGSYAIKPFMETFLESLDQDEARGTLDAAQHFIIKDDDGDTYITVEESVDEDIVHIYTAGTERLTIDKYGHIKIKTSGAEIRGSFNAEFIQLDNDYTNLGHTNVGIWGSPTSIVVALDDNNSRGDGVFVIGHDGYYPGDTNWEELFRVTEGGNIGIGTTDIEPWANPFKVMEFPYDAIMFSKNHPFIQLTHNAYWDGSYKYKSTAEAARLLINNGMFTFTTAPSGTVDTTISWTDVIKVLNSGNIGFGTNNPSVNADLTLGGGVLCLKETTTPTADANYGKVYTKTDNKLYFQDGTGTEHEIAFV